MPYSGEGTEAEIEQRRDAARTHGAYAFRDRGEQALEQPQRSRLEELKEQVRERTGVLQLMQERAANAVMMTELVTSYIAREVKMGVPLSQIGAVRSLPAFLMAGCARSRLSCTAASGNPTIAIPGRPSAVSTSTSTITPSRPITAQE